MPIHVGLRPARSHRIGHTTPRMISMIQVMIILLRVIGGKAIITAANSKQENSQQINPLF
jgi:methyl coenzyme M reductase subunit D